MKTSFLLGLLVCISFSGNSQIDNESKNILEILLRVNHPKENTLFYTDRLGSSQVSLIKKAFKGRLFASGFKKYKNDTLYLSVSEKRYIDHSINKIKRHYWPDSLFTNSKRIPENSMWNRISEKNREFYNSFASDTSKKNTVNSINNRVYSANTFQFMPPIYIRNKSIFLIYFMRMCGGLCGEDELAFYKLENGTYKKWILISGRAF